MGDEENDYDAIARGIAWALGAFLGSAHEPPNNTSDSITMTKTGFITGVIRLQRLQDYVEGLATAHREDLAEIDPAIAFVQDTIAALEKEGL